MRSGQLATSDSGRGQSDISPPGTADLPASYPWGNLPALTWINRVLCQRPSPLIPRDFQAFAALARDRRVARLEAPRARARRARFVGADALQRRRPVAAAALALASAGRGDRCIVRERRHLRPARLAETSSSRVIVPARGRKASRISIAASICPRRRRASRAIRAIARPRRGSATLCARSAASRRWEAGALASEAWISRMAGAIDSRGSTRPL